MDFFLEVGSRMVGLAFVLWMFYNLCAHRTFFHASNHLWLGARKGAVKIVAPFGWVTDFIPPGRHHGGYDGLMPGPLSVWYWFAWEGRSSFRIQNRTDKVLVIGWGPNGGGDPRSPHWGEVTLGPKCRARVQILAWYHGVVFSVQTREEVDASLGIYHPEVAAPKAAPDTAIKAAD